MTMVLNWLVSLFLAFIKPSHSLMLWLVLNWLIYVFSLHSPNQDIFGARPSRVYWSLSLLFLLCPQLGYMVSLFSDYATFDYTDLTYLTGTGNTDLPGVWVFDIAAASWTRMVYLHFMMTSSNKTFSALLALCVGNSPITGEFPSKRPVTRSFDVFFGLRLNKQWSKQSCCRWCEMPSYPLWRYCIGGGQVCRHQMSRTGKRNYRLTSSISPH